MINITNLIFNRFTIKIRFEGKSHIYEKYTYLISIARGLRRRL